MVCFPLRISEAVELTGKNVLQIKHLFQTSLQRLLDNFSRRQTFSELRWRCVQKCIDVFVWSVRYFCPIYKKNFTGLTKWKSVQVFSIFYVRTDGWAEQSQQALVWDMKIPANQKQFGHSFLSNLLNTRTIKHMPVFFSSYNVNAFWSCL
jgi:hypothetical protein